MISLWSIVSFLPMSIKLKYVYKVEKIYVMLTTSNNYCSIYLNLTMFYIILISSKPTNTRTTNT